MTSTRPTSTRTRTRTTTTTIELGLVPPFADVEASDSWSGRGRPDRSGVRGREREPTIRHGSTVEHGERGVGR
jgi:hypothetical protein